MPQPLPIPLLICSIGNPTRQFADTLHSTGHGVLDAIRIIIRYPEWKPYLSGQVSHLTEASRQRWTLFKGVQKNLPRREEEDDWTFWKSGALMNLSGPAVKRCWDKWQAEWEPRRARGKLIIVHDELESEWGVVSVRDGKSSARGHNGVKSLQASLGGTPFTRICVGIGRPSSREPSVVAKYVLRQMTEREKSTIGERAHSTIRIVRDICDGVR